MFHTGVCLFNTILFHTGVCLFNTILFHTGVGLPNTGVGLLHTGVYLFHIGIELFHSEVGLYGVPPRSRPIRLRSRPVPLKSRPVPHKTRPVPHGSRPVSQRSRPVPPRSPLRSRPVPHKTRPIPHRSRLAYTRVVHVHRGVGQVHTEADLHARSPASLYCKNIRGTGVITIYAPMIYTAPCIMFWMHILHTYPLRGEVGGGWALEFSSFLGPLKWHQADRRVPFGAQKTQEFQGPSPSHFSKYWICTHPKHHAQGCINQRLFYAHEPPGDFNKCILGKSRAHTLGGGECE